MIGVAMRHRNPGIGEASDAGGDAGHDAEGHAGFRQLLRFLAAPPEDERVAAFQPQHPAAFFRQVDQQGGNVALLAGGDAGALAGEDQAGAFFRQGQQPLIDQGVVENEVGHAEGVKAQRGDQAGIARPAAHQPDPAFFKGGQVQGGGNVALCHAGIIERFGRIADFCQRNGDG